MSRKLGEPNWFERFLDWWALLGQPKVTKKFTSRRVAWVCTRKREDARVEVLLVNMVQGGLQLPSQYAWDGWSDEETLLHMARLSLGVELDPSTIKKCATSGNTHFYLAAHVNLPHATTLVYSLRWTDLAEVVDVPESDAHMMVHLLQQSIPR